MYLLEAERDLAVANCRELLRVTQDPRVRIELQIAALAARTGCARRLPVFGGRPDLNQPGASIPAPSLAGAASPVREQPRHLLSR